MTQFLQRQRQKLDELIQRIPASQRGIYNQRIRRLEETIRRKEQEIRHPEQIRDIKGTLRSEDKRLNKHVDSRGAHLYTNINKFAKPSIGSISKGVSDKAVLTRASTVFKRTGKANTEAYLEAHGLDGYEILPESSDTALVVRAPDGKVKIAFRGTLVPGGLGEVGASARDVSLDFGYFTSTEARHPDYRSDDALVRDVTGKYDVDELLGFSLGGAKAHSFGEKYGVDTTSFNPLVGQTFINSGESNVRHNIYRTTEDLPSSGTALIDRENVDVKSIYPLKNYSTNPKRTHDLENFIASQERVKQSNIKRLTDLSVSKGQRISEYSLLDDMLESKGSFSDWLHKYNNGSNGVDTGIDGKLLPTVRASDKTVHGKLWRKLGRDFTAEEQAVFDTRDLPEQEHTLSDSEIDAYIHNDNEGRGEIYDSSLESLQNVNQDLSDAMSSPIEAREGGIDRSASLLTGLLAGEAAGQGVGAVEKLTGRKLTATQRAGVVGGLGAVGSEVGVAGLSGVAAGGLVPAAAIGGAAGIAAQQTETAASRFGATPLEAQVAGGEAGGLVGAIGAGVAAGLPLDPETLGGSSLIGGALGGLSYGLHQLGVSL
jgi:hypothetical protein